MKNLAYFSLILVILVGFTQCNSDRILLTQEEKHLYPPDIDFMYMWQTLYKNPKLAYQLNDEIKDDKPVNWQKIAKDYKFEYEHYFNLITNDTFHLTASTLIHTQTQDKIDTLFFIKINYIYQKLQFSQNSIWRIKELTYSIKHLESVYVDIERTLDYYISNKTTLNEMTNISIQLTREPDEPHLSSPKSMFAIRNQLITNSNYCKIWHRNHIIDRDSPSDKDFRNHVKQQIFQTEKDIYIKIQKPTFFNGKTILNRNEE